MEACSHDDVIGDDLDQQTASTFITFSASTNTIIYERQRWLKVMVKKRPLMLLPHNDCLHYVASNSVLYIFTFDEFCQYRLPVVGLHKFLGPIDFSHFSQKNILIIIVSFYWPKFITTSTFYQEHL